MTDEQIANAVATNNSYASALRALGLSTGSQSYIIIKGHIARMGLSTAHFKGRKRPFNKKVPLSEKLVKGSSPTGLKNRLVEEGLLSYRCSEPDCGLFEWKGKPLTLQLDHINGDRYDNRLENLRLLCPNCHSQTPTYSRPKSPGKVTYSCGKCGCNIRKGSTLCVQCSNASRASQKIQWPDDQKIICMIESSSVTAVARTLGVSGTAIVKHLRRRGYKVKNKKVFPIA